MTATEVAIPGDLDFLDLPNGMVAPRHHPYELHWRVAPPKWTGNLDAAHGRLYSHLAGQCCCFYCGSVPCPIDHEELKRVRLADLEFVKDMAKERREYKEKSEQLKNDICEWEKKEEFWEKSKLMLETKVREFEEKQKRWEQERLLMEREIERLRSINDQTQYQLGLLKKNEAKLKLLQLRIDALYAENEDLKGENAKFKKMIINQENEIQRLGKENKQLNCDLIEAKQSVRSLKVQVDQYMEDVQILKDDMNKKDAKIKELHESLQSLMEELKIKTKLFEEKEIQLEELINVLRTEIGKLNDRVLQSDARSDDLQRRLAAAMREIEILRKKLANSGRFRKYVEVKREVLDLRDKNDALVHRFSEELKPILPVMKTDGRVKSAGVKFNGVDLQYDRPRSAKRNNSFSDISLSSSSSNNDILR